MNYTLGKFIPQVKGNYSASTTYTILDIVYYQGSSYICKTNSVSNKIPTNTTYWQQLAAAGQATMTPEQMQQVITTLINNYNVVTDADYNNFSDEEKDKLANLTAPNNGTLTIKRNNSTLGTFTADTSTNTTVNISVPTAIEDLSHWNKCWNDRDKVISSDTNAQIDKLLPHTVYYYLNALDSFKVDAYGFGTTNPEEMMVQPDTWIWFKVGPNDIIPTFPATPTSYFDVTGSRPQFQAGKMYLIHVVGNVWRFAELSNL